jgi:hypothetical protein
MPSRNLNALFGIKRFCPLHCASSKIRLFLGAFLRGRQPAPPARGDFGAGGRAGQFGSRSHRPAAILQAGNLATGPTGYFLASSSVGGGAASGANTLTTPTVGSSSNS